MGKRPSIQFYPGDWREDTGLQSCSLTARGLWIEMMILMHAGKPYGHLKVGAKVILPPNLARMVGGTLEEVTKGLSELEEAEVFSRTADGTIFSRRMVRDEEIRRKRAAGGRLGGNPALTGARKDNLPANLDVNLEPTLGVTPSSSSSSPSSEKKKSPPDPPKGGASRGRKIPQVKIPEALLEIGIDAASFATRVRTCKVTKRPEAWQAELDGLAGVLHEVGREVVQALWEETSSTGYQGCTPTMCRDRAARAGSLKTTGKVRRLDTSGMPKEFHR